MGLFDLFKSKKNDDEAIEEAYNCTDDEDDDDDDESLDVYDAALIWMSNGKDEDYTFGYTEEELEDALR
ncbi:MAG: hypothetical protein KH324_01280 [Ruminococcus sp.]|nr:hypothetical protein [Ruminococcus sp.]